MNNPLLLLLSVSFFALKIWDCLFHRLSAIEHKPKRRFWRYSLRTFFVLLTVACVLLAILVNGAREQRRTVKWVWRHGGTVEYHPSTGIPNELRKLVGVDLFDCVVSVNFDDTQVSDVTPLDGLKNLETLSLENTQVSDLTPLAGLNKLTQLNVRRTQVSDVSPLVRMNRLYKLSLDDTPVSELGSLASLNTLYELSLGNTQASDITALAGLENLENVNLDGLNNVCLTCTQVRNAIAQN